MYELDELKQEQNLRQVWPNEAGDFTPWVAENLNLIGDILGMDLELAETESRVGSYSADILAKEADTENYVIIENQLEDSNHDHLGKLITYASGKNAKASVWVVRKARDEHKKAIEWLNDNTGPQIGFYLLEIELWRIGNSKLAPRFNVIESPNEWAKTTKPSSNVSDTQILQREFWQSFIDYANKKKDFIKIFRLRSASARNWYNIGIGSSRYHICLEAKNSKQEATVGIYISDDKELYHNFEANKKTIETALNCELQWTIANKASRFYAVQKLDMGDSSTWNNIFQWYIDKSIIFKKIAQEYLCRTPAS